ncbi:hypothetical protein ACQEU6_12340 [Spirillospora sp. CA-108201]
MSAVAVLGISSIFAVYTFIGPFVTDAALRDASLIPIALAAFAPDAPALMGALNLANSLGALGGAVTIGAGWGTLPTVRAGFALTTAGLILYLVTVARRKPTGGPASSLSPARPTASLQKPFRLGDGRLRRRVRPWSGRVPRCRLDLDIAAWRQ